MKIIDRRLRKLEDQFGRADGTPRRCLRMTISAAGAKPSLEDATCRRTFWSDGTLFEIIEFNAHNTGPDELTEEDLDKWLESFPVD